MTTQHTKRDRRARSGKATDALGAGPPSEQLLRPIDVRRLLGVSRYVLRQLVDQEILRPLRIATLRDGKIIERFKKRDVDRLVKPTCNRVNGKGSVR